MKEKYNTWLTKIITIEKIEFYQLRIESDKGYYIIEINPNTKESYLTKNRMKNG